MHVEIVIAGLELIELIRRQCDRGGPDTAARFTLCHREHDRTRNPAYAEMDMGLLAIDICGNDAGFHFVRGRIYANDSGTCAIAGDTRYLFRTGQCAGEYILRYLAID